MTDNRANAHLTLDSLFSSSPSTLAARNSNQHYQLHHQQQQQEGAAGGGGGMLSFSWLDRPRERRLQKLQQQAEEQLQKIVEAELARKAAESQSSSSNGQSVFREISKCAAALPEQPTCVPLSRSGGSSNSADISVDSATKRKIGVSDVSKSGEGASAHLDLANVLGINNDEEQDDEIEEFPIPPVRVQRLEGDSGNPLILSKDQMYAIASHVLPKTIAFCRWRRLYGLNRDGDSFDACLRIIGTEQRTLMVIRNTKGEIFGGFTDTAWHLNDKGSTSGFYGSALACLFSFSDRYTPNKPNSKTRTCYRLNGNHNSNEITPTESYINVFRWTGKNRYIQLCDVHNKMIAFGGGGQDGAFGVCVQEDFQRGSTGPCDTFDNDPLCEHGSFDIVDVEFWAFMTGTF